MAKHLTANEKAQTRVLFALLILALTMEKVGELSGNEGNLPAVQQCSAFIDEVIEAKSVETRDAMIARIQVIRTRFTHKVKNMDAASAMVGAIRHIVSPTYKSKAGTRFDFIRQTLRTNLKMIEDTLPKNEAEVAKFEEFFKAAVLSI